MSRGPRAFQPIPRTDSEWEALLYDWHNEYRLDEQRKDVDYWLDATARATRLLVLGAGTGRIAVPLAQCLPRTTAALDVSLPRLRRMPTVPGLVAICGDMRSLPMNGPFEAVVAPYSTFQLLPTARDRGAALAEAARVLESDGLLHIDLSESFDRRPATEWQVTLRAPCQAVQAVVVEWERSLPASDHVLITKRFCLEDGTVLAEVDERWVYLSCLDLDHELDRAGFDLIGTDRGYDADRSQHRLIFRARRST